MNCESFEKLIYRTQERIEVGREVDAAVRYDLRDLWENPRPYSPEEVNSRGDRVVGISIFAVMQGGSLTV